MSEKEIERLEGFNCRRCGVHVHVRSFIDNGKIKCICGHERIFTEAEIARFENIKKDSR